LAETVIAALTKQVGSYVAGLDLSTVFEGVTEVPAALKGLKGVPLGNAGGLTKGAADTIKGAAEGAGKALDKLFGD
jgi:hypothetical protein